MTNTDANTTSYVTSSDARLKKDAGDWSALDIISDVPARKYERLCNPGVIEYGFFAQELVNGVPQAVNVGGEDVETEIWGVDYGKVTGVLWKAIQEQQALITALSARLAALEAK